MCIGPTMLGVVVSICSWLKDLPFSNFAQQLPATRYNMQQVCKQTQQVTSNNVEFACTGLKVRETTILGLWFCS